MNVHENKKISLIIHVFLYTKSVCASHFYLPLRAELQKTFLYVIE